MRAINCIATENLSLSEKLLDMTFAQAQMNSKTERNTLVGEGTQDECKTDSKNEQKLISFYASRIALLFIYIHICIFPQTGALTVRINISFKHPWLYMRLILGIKVLFGKPWED